MTSDRFVLDASALVEFLSGYDANRALLRRLLTGAASAPEIIDLDVISTLRKHARRGRLTEKAADDAITDLQQFPVARSPHRSLAPRVWQLRHAITPYDAAYVALAEELGVPLVTTDAKLPRVNGHDAEIELYPAS